MEITLLVLSILFLWSFSWCQREGGGGRGRGREGKKLEGPDNQVRVVGPDLAIVS